MTEHLLTGDGPVADPVIEGDEIEAAADDLLAALGDNDPMPDSPEAFMDAFEEMDTTDADDCADHPLHATTDEEKQEFIGEIADAVKDGGVIGTAPTNHNHTYTTEELMPPENEMTMLDVQECIQRIWKRDRNGLSRHSLKKLNKLRAWIDECVAREALL